MVLAAIALSDKSEICFKIPLKKKKTTNMFIPFPLVTLGCSVGANLGTCVRVVAVGFALNKD